MVGSFPDTAGACLPLMGPVFAGISTQNIIRSFQRKHSAYLQELEDVI